MDKEELLDYLLARFGVSAEELMAHRLFYNNHFDQYGNDIYADIKTRLVHLQNFWESDFWFNQRYDLLSRHYESFDQVIELGFSLPYIHMQLPKNKPTTKFLLVDYYESAIQITDAMLDYLKVNDVKLLRADIQSDSGWASIRQNFIEGGRLFVAIETIEHLSNPEVLWENIRHLKGEKMIMSLPIGPTIPSHQLVFSSEEQALGYIGRYLEVEETQVISSSGSPSRGMDEYKVIIVYGTIKQ